MAIMTPVMKEMIGSSFYLEVVGETHGEATDNKAGVVEEQSLSSNIIGVVGIHLLSKITTCPS